MTSGSTLWPAVFGNSLRGGPTEGLNSAVYPILPGRVQAYLIVLSPKDILPC